MVNHGKTLSKVATPCAPRIDVESLDALLAERPAGFDLVVGSDLVFPSNSDAYGPLVDTLEVLLRAHADAGAATRTEGGGAGEPTPAGPGSAADTRAPLEVWLAHEPRRPEVEAAFWTLLEDRGIEVEVANA